MPRCSFGIKREDNEEVLKKWLMFQKEMLNNELLFYNQDTVFFYSTDGWVSLWVALARSHDPKNTIKDPFFFVLQDYIFLFVKPIIFPR